jgi:lipoate-protein ligase A
VWPAAVADPGRRAVARCRVDGPAVVLGSLQDGGVVDPGRAAARGLGVARRRTGGGAVLVAPGDPVWTEVWLPRGDPRWVDDVAASFHWLGATWVRALARLGLDGLTVHRGPWVARSPWSSLVCFDGLGPGEVVDDRGRKVVGLAQRRSRDGARFHAACPVRWDAGPLVEVLSVTDGRRDDLAVTVARAGVGVADLADERGVAVPTAGDVVAALAAELPPG